MRVLVVDPESGGALCAGLVAQGLDAQAWPDADHRAPGTEVVLFNTSVDRAILQARAWRAAGCRAIMLLVVPEWDCLRIMRAVLGSALDDVVVSPVTADTLRLKARLFHRLAGLAPDQASSHAELIHLATRDPLTGVCNRTAILGHLYREVARAIRGGTDVGAVMFDVDHFKSINDGMGHAIGDQLLQALALRAARPMRPYDALGRMGGDEFLLILPGCHTPAASRIARRLLALAGNPYDTPGHVAVTVGISVGVACLDHVGLEAVCANGPQHLLQCADAALLEAKRRGRGRVHAWPRTARQRSINDDSAASNSSGSNGLARNAERPSVRTRARS